MRRQHVEPTPTPPPEIPAPNRRGFDRTFGIVTLIVMVVVLGGMVVYFKHRATADGSGPPSPVASASVSASASSTDVGAVQAAYLQYWDAQIRAGLAADPSLVAPYTTPSGLADFERIFEPPTSTARFRITAEHSMQTVVYQGGVTASVDDLLSQHVASVDPSSLRPISPPSDEVDEESTVLVKSNGTWLVDSEVSFGGTVPTPRAPVVSYAAINRATPLDPQMSATLMSSYLTYWDRRAQTLSADDVTAESKVVQSAALAAESTIVQELKSKGQAFHVQVEHNTRVALKDASTAEVYDTMLDSSWYLQLVSGGRVGNNVPVLVRLGFEMIRGPDGWKVAVTRSYQP